MNDRIVIAEVLVGQLRGYCAIGLVVAVLFALFGVSRVDAGARLDRGAPVGSVLFRVLLLPAATLLWPLVLVRAIVTLRATRSAPAPAGPTGSVEPRSAESKKDAP